jgi:hypothetical protein
MKTRIYLAACLISLAAQTNLNAVMTITRHPTNQWVSLGAHVTNDVVATTTAPPLTYQWYGLGALLPDATNRVLILTNIQLAQAGEYYVVVNDTNNVPLESNHATISVDPTFVKITSGAIVTDVEPTEDSTWLDCNNDNLLDVVVHVAPPHGPGVSQTFYRNNGNFTFTRITNAVTQTLRRGLIGAVGDIDNDGYPDLYLGSNAWQSNEPKDDLFRNIGNGLFSALVNTPWIQEQDHTFDCTFVDYDRDGLLDVFVINYDQPPCLYRQTVAGAFLKMTAGQVGSILANPGHSYNAVWVDYDNDGDLDLWIENSQGPGRLHQNNGAGFFTLATPPSFAQSPGGHGVWADLDNDGFPELFIGGDTETGTRANALYRGLAGQNFTNVAVQAGVAITMATWASAVGDYNNDGWLDIFAADWTGTRTNVLFLNHRDGTFETVDVGSPIRDGADLRMGARWVDINNDGFLDLFMTCGTADGSATYPRLNHLYRNNGPAIGNTNHWLKIKLNGQTANRSGIGAKIRVKATIGGQVVWQLREMTGNGYSQTSPGLVAHFGLGDATKADIVRVEWPSGNMQELVDVTPDRLLSITEQTFIAPTRPSASLNGSVTLTRSVVSGATYQWRFDGVDLVGQTNRILNLTNIVAGQEGRYSVVVSNETTLVTNYVYLLVDTQFERIVMGDTGASWGCGWGDYDDDGYPDLIVGEGTFTSTKACSLYRNNQDGTLTKVTPAEVGDIASLARNWQSVAWGNYDNDDHLDLIVSENPPSGESRAALWRNVGNGRFEQATNAGSFATDRLWGTPSWGDFNRDGWIDLAVANAWDQPPSWGDWCRNLLYFNRGDETFRKETQGEFLAFRSQAQVEGGAAGDMDGDGDLDILVGSHSGVILFENDGAGGFHRVTAGFPSVTGTALAPAWADYDNDGRLDVFVPVHHGDSMSSLIHNDGNGQWTRIPLGAVNQCGGASWADYDNDGDLDLIITRGQNTTATKLFYANNGDGTFTQITLGSIANDVGLWADSAWGDFDNNGFQDLFVTSHGGYPEVLYRNHGNSNHWVSFKLLGTRSNRSAIGAKVRVQANIFGKNVTQMREIGGGNRSQNDLRPHFGLGNATLAATVRVEWPSGCVEEFKNLPRDQIHTLVEPSLRGGMKPNGEFELIATASTNRVCQLDYSSDLVNWTSLTNFTGQGETPVTVTELPTQTQRFYRLK